MLKNYEVRLCISRVADIPAFAARPVLSGYITADRDDCAILYVCAENSIQAGKIVNQHLWGTTARIAYIQFASMFHPTEVAQTESNDDSNECQDLMADTDV